jgi:erythronate-4-phosphate dehydrogenase
MYTMAMKIIADENIIFVKEAFSEFGEVVTVPGRGINREILQDAHILLVRSVTNVNADLLKDTSIKLVASATVGIDHIDRNFLVENNIGFAYAPGSNAESVAEYVTSAILVLSKKLHKKIPNLTIGIVGAGNVGSRVVRHARALGMKSLVCDPPKKRLTGSDYYREMHELLDNSDIITLHVPLTCEGEDTTYHLVNHEFISRMKRGAIIINTSRGKVIEEKGIRAGRERMGALVFDVWENEPAINLEMLRSVDIATPHIAGYSYDGKVRGTKMIYDAACAFFFRKETWQPSSELLSKTETVDLSDSKDPLYDAVQAAYPIMRDDEDMRATLLSNQKKSFDDLRKNYPRRPEFNHFLFKLSENQKEAVPVLEDLGFKTEMKKEAKI